MRLTTKCFKPLLAPESLLAVSLFPGYILLPGCRGKPAWLSQNRMSSTSELARFAAHLRESILTSEWGAQTSPGVPGARASSPLCASLDHSRVPMEIGRPKRAGSPRAGVSTGFESLALQLFALQFEHNAPYRRLCEARGAHRDTVARWTDIPAAPTSAFKEFDLSCLPAEERTTVFHSSGTTGQKPSRHYHNAASLAVYEAALLKWFYAHFQWPMADSQAGKTEPKLGCGLATGDWQLAILTPPPAQSPHSSLVHMFETIRREFGGDGLAFVGKAAHDGAWTLNTEAALARLQAARRTAHPLLLLGTAFSFVHLLDYLAEHDLRFELPPGSCALETGGYKGRSRSLPKAALHALISERLGIPPDRIICEYGMSELSSQAYDSVVSPSRFTLHASRLFRFPPWARVQIISPETGCEVAEGETGLIRVFDLANVYSVMAIQTEDLGIRRGNGFALAGRAVFAEPRGCSLLAV